MRAGPRARGPMRCGRGPAFWEPIYYVDQSGSARLKIVRRPDQKKKKIVRRGPG